MSKFTRRFVKLIAITAALWLGWTASGRYGHHLPGVAVSMASDVAAPETSHGSASERLGGDEEHLHANENAHEDQAGHEAGADVLTAETLVPRDEHEQARQPGWYRPVLIVGLALFAAALLVGLIATVTGSPLQAIGLDKHDAHDDHDTHDAGHH